MSNKPNRPEYINSPAYREAKSDLIALLITFAFFTTLFVVAILMTGGDR